MGNRRVIFMNCMNCLHCNVCIHRKELKGLQHEKGFKCTDYAAKELYIKIPCRVGTRVYGIATPCGGCKYYNEPMKEEFIETCRMCRKREIIEIGFDNECIDEFGKTVFLSKKEAEAALVKTQKGN